MGRSTRDLIGSLEGRPVTACELAALLLEECPFREHFSSDFEKGLRAASGNEPGCGEKEWLDRLKQICSTADRSAARAFFSLVLIDERFALQFQRGAPSTIGFERHQREFIDSLDHRHSQAWDRTIGLVPTKEDRLAHPNFARALDRGVVSAALVAEAYFGMGSFNPNATSRGQLKRFHPLLLASFEEKNGCVVSDYWCRNIPVGMFRTEKGKQLHLFVNEFPPDAVAITDRCEEVFRDIVEYLKGRERELLTADIYAVLTGIYGDLDRAAAKSKPPKLSAQELAHHQKRLGDTERQARQGMRRRAQGWYILGTFIGVLALAGFFAVLSIFATGNWSRLFEGAIFGASGALASVLFRMQRDELRVNPRQGMKMIGAAALVRPLMGAIFGGITVVVLLSGLLPIEVTEAEPQQFYFLSSLAFVAGFTERWAPNLLELAGKQAHPGEKQEADPDSP
ncbi:MAG TPA: hypothetical protein VFR75_06400 [Solirubrobacterales bacterium]|nr:hypothetical protein [Solirubrobacterales bacterium]